MKYGNSCKDMFESILDYRKIVLLKFLIQNDDDIITDCGFLRKDINSLNDEIENNLREQNEKYLDYIKNEEEAVLKRFPDK